MTDPTPADVSLAVLRLDVVADFVATDTGSSGAGPRELVGDGILIGIVFATAHPEMARAIASDFLTQSPDGATERQELGDWIADARITNRPDLTAALEALFRQRLDRARGMRAEDAPPEPVSLEDRRRERGQR